MWYTAANHNYMCHIIFAKGLLDSNFTQTVINIYQIFTKLPYISHIYEIRNFFKYDKESNVLKFSFTLLDMYFHLLFAVKCNKITIDIDITKANYLCLLHYSSASYKFPSLMYACARFIKSRGNCVRATLA